MDEMHEASRGGNEDEAGVDPGSPDRRRPYAWSPRTVNPAFPRYGRRVTTPMTSHANAPREGRLGAPVLSICIATFGRARFIGETLDSILPQLAREVEVVVVDGASPDDTAGAVARHAGGHPGVRYHREPKNSGVDADYDKAVAYARGDYCWLMTDDDVLAPGAVARVLSELASGPDAIIVDAETRTTDLSRVVDARLLRRSGARDYAAAEADALLADTGNYLTFIGAVVVRREAWLSRDRESYYGTAFIHVGVLFQDPPLREVRVLADPLVRIRLANSMWSPRGFETFMFRWPDLIWSLGTHSREARAAVVPREPWRNPRMLGLYRAMGSYSVAEYRRLLAPRAGWPYRILAAAIARAPRSVASVLATLYCIVAVRHEPRFLYDLSAGPDSSWLARWAARRTGLRG